MQWTRHVLLLLIECFDAIQHCDTDIHISPLCSAPECNANGEVGLCDSVGVSV